MIRHALALVAATYAGTSLIAWFLSGFIPWFLLPDVPFLAIVYAGLFLPGPAGFLCALAIACFREVTTSAPTWSFLLSSVALYFVSREISIRLFVRPETIILLGVGGLMTVESLSLVGLMTLAGTRAFHVLWAGEEAVRIAWTSLLSVPLFLNFSALWLQVKE